MISRPVWKILVMNKLSQDVISPLLPVKVLRELGVTLHLLVGSKREVLTDVLAVYFVSPTDETRGMYDSFHINMISPLSCARLENLAFAAVQGGIIAQVQKALFTKSKKRFVCRATVLRESPMSYYGKRLLSLLKSSWILIIQKSSF
ncbi:unnamed protein product [Cylicostephanus goldi]|uniref:Uncharacterized protein n=1 Tax=Cylicostephanus goldi TaxID=71465 RepID=A0A3P6QXH7_CYLGO|nr:unnamed protein product [Cylicostephanus goldi]